MRISEVNDPTSPWPSRRFCSDLLESHPILWFRLIGLQVIVLLRPAVMSGGHNKLVARKAVQMVRDHSSTANAAG